MNTKELNEMRAICSERDFCILESECPYVALCTELEYYPKEWDDEDIEFLADEEVILIVKPNDLDKAKAVFESTPMRGNDNARAFTDWFLSNPYLLCEERGEIELLKEVIDELEEDIEFYIERFGTIEEIIEEEEEVMIQLHRAPTEFKNYFHFEGGEGEV